jgi:hypothetical protein
MEDFNTRKRNYLERLRNNPRLVEGIMNKKDTNSPEAMLAVFDPRTEEEVIFAEGITTILDDAIKMFMDYGEIEIEDYNQEVIYTLFKRVIMALKERDEEELNNIQEELSKFSSPEMLGELSFGIIKVFALNAYDAFEKLSIDCGFGDDNLAFDQFTPYFNIANAKINQMMPTTNLDKTPDFKNKELISFVKRYTDRFHELYLETFEKKKGFNL